ncbi:hypothetical protein JIX56_17600 [Streptomyces sp. CA-210063]|uniref:hypothetical protein n=1 Tax=Streptomyces sp. CA-210063 TaxID=2801029 RepID=UPI00214C3862|nr:hypothetical protein [Streptomyces sp. CA-210063]UUU31574.1 hypothetical protein JIX56_17600 [Streptomyces sp. CA-210063]
MASNPNRTPGDSGAAPDNERIRAGLTGLAGRDPRLSGHDPIGGDSRADGSTRAGGDDRLGSRPGAAAGVNTTEPRRTPAPTRAPLPDAARRRSPHPPPEPTTPRPRVEVTFNELTGTMSWRPLSHTPSATAQQGGTGSPQTPHRRTPEETPWSARAAALRSAGLDPSRAPTKGASPIPTHPAAVRAAASVDVASLTPEQQRRHLARLGALRSGVTADLAHGTRMPTPVASRLRSTSATPAHAHALAKQHSSAATRPPTPGTPAHRPSR